jgi:hypothetical protein
VPFVEDSIIFAYNTVVQLAMGKVASAVTKLDTTGIVDGQRAGITLFGQTYGWIGVVAHGWQGHRAPVPPLARSSAAWLTSTRASLSTA